MKKKVLFMMNTLLGGGAEKVLLDIVNNLDPEKYDITVHLLYKEGKYCPRLHDNIRLRAVAPSLDGIGGRMISKLLFSRKRLFYSLIYRLFVQDGYDIEIAFLEGWPTKLLAASPCRKKIAWVHIDLSEFYDGQELVYDSVEENIGAYRNFDKIICVSQAALDGFRRKFGGFEQLCVQYNPLDADSIRKKAQESPKPEFSGRSFNIVAVGRLTEQKGFDRLIQAVSILVKEGIDVKLLLLGAGELEERLKDQAEELNLKDNVVFTGFCDNPYSYMSRADLFVSSSVAEGYSLVVAEALICGCPVVSTRTSGPCEILGFGKYGLLVDNSCEGIYSGIKRMILEPELLEHYRKQAADRGNQFILRNVIEEIEHHLDEMD